MCVLFVCLLISGSLRTRLCHFQSLFPITIESFYWTEFHCEMENRTNWKSNWKHVSIVDTRVSANLEFISLFSLLGQCREGKHQLNKSKYRFFFLFFHWKKSLYCTKQTVFALFWWAWNPPDPVLQFSDAMKNFCSFQAIFSTAVKLDPDKLVWTGLSLLTEKKWDRSMPVEKLVHYYERWYWCWWHFVGNESRLLQPDSAQRGPGAKPV